MALQAGSRLGPYEIVGALGAGGMGEVYKARDTRLDRLVAIKILPVSLAADPVFRERFEREARLISALDHPHICALYDVGEQDGVSFLVMQYLAGETLAARLERRAPALTIDEALTYAIEIADALTKAHRQRIVHRDLKPGNIMLTKSGTRLLDFGLAKVAVPSIATTGVSNLPTTREAGAGDALTAQGTILGTFQYMSPEQIEGRDADARADIFAFGAIVHEMVTGRKAFEGKSQASLIGAIMHGEPPAISSLRPLAPVALDRIVKHCLVKDPDERFQSAADVARELRWVVEDRARSTAVGTADGQRPAVAASSSGRQRLLTAIGLVALGAGVAGTIVWFLKPAPAPTFAIVRSQVNVAPADQLQASPADPIQAEGRPTRTAIVLAPDGKSVVFSAVAGGQQRLFVRALDQLDATPIAGTEDATSPFLSPDGRWVGFWARGALRKMTLAGGPPSVIAESPEPFGVSWGTNDMIVFGRFRGGLMRVPASGGKPEPVTELDSSKGDVSHRLPFVLPGGDAVVFTVTRANLPIWDNTEVALQSLKSGEHKVLVEGGADARYVPTGHLVYLRSGTLMAAPFDLERLAVTGGAVGLVSDVMQAANLLFFARDSGAGQFSISASGSLAYVTGGVAPDPERTLAWVGGSGAADNIEPLSAPVRPYIGPRVSPDGRYVAAWLQGIDRSIWMYDIARQTMARFTSDGRNSWPIWTPDGTHLAFASAVVGPLALFWKPTAVGGGNPAERLDTSPNSRYPGSWTPDGKTLVFHEENPTTGGDIGALDVDTRQVRPILQTRFYEQLPDLSPDGRWLAYTSDAGGRQDVYVQPYPGPGMSRQISVAGGVAPAWSKDGKELFFLRFTRPATATGSAVTAIFSALLTITPSGLTSGTPRLLVEGKFAGTGPIRWYDVVDVTPGRHRFLVVQEKERPPVRPNQIVLVQNWFDELTRRVPAR